MDEVRELKSHQVGVQIPGRVHSQVSEEDAIWAYSTDPSGSLPQADRAEALSDRGRASAAGSRAQVDHDPAEICGVASNRVHQGQAADGANGLTFLGIISRKQLASVSTSVHFKAIFSLRRQPVSAI